MTEPGRLGREPDAGRSGSLEADNTRLRAALAWMGDVIRKFPSPFIILDRNCDVVTWNHGAERLYGYTAEEMVGESYLELIPWTTRHDERERFEREFDGGPVSPALVERVDNRGHVFSVLNEIISVPTESGDRLAVSDHDVSERIEAERGREELRRTLDHRVKNMLTMIRGFLDESLTGSCDSVETFAAAARNRLGALAIAHRTMTDDGDGADLGKLIELILSALELEDRVSAKGEKLTLPGTAVSPLSMALHELAANAVRHGALSRVEGRVDLRWEVEDGHVRIVWQEVGGPRVGRSGQRGLGARLIEEAVPYELGGAAQIDLRTAGVRCEMWIPISDDAP